MLTQYSPTTDTFTVKLSREELVKAFDNPTALQELLHNIARDVYGEDVATYLFPIK